MFTCVEEWGSAYSLLLTLPLRAVPAFSRALILAVQECCDGTESLKSEVVVSFFCENLLCSRQQSVCYHTYLRVFVVHDVCQMSHFLFCQLIQKLT